MLEYVLLGMIKSNLTSKILINLTDKKKYNKTNAFVVN